MSYNDDEEVVVVKKGGFFGKFICLLLGVVLGVGATVGGVYAATTIVTVKDAASIANVKPETLHKYLGEEYAEKTVAELIGPVGKAFIGFATGEGTLRDLAEISPAVEDKIVDLTDSFEDSYSVKISPDALLDSTLKEIPQVLKDTLYSIPLADILSLDVENSLMMYIAYGKKGVHYTLETVDGKTEAVGCRQRIALDETGNAYNAYGEPWSGTLNTERTTFTTIVNEETIVYQIDKTTPVSEPTTVKIAGSDAVYATYYYINDADGNELKYEPLNFGDLSGDSDTLDKLTSRLTLKEAIGEEAIEETTFFELVADVVIADIPSAIESLTINEVFKNEIYVDTNGNGVIDETETDVKGEWWYLLHKPDDSIGEYSLTEMDCLIDNMMNNVYAATIYQLYNDGMIQGLDITTLDQDVRWKIGTVVDFSTKLDEKGIPYGTNPSTGFNYRIGDLTVTQTMTYLSILFAQIDLLGI